MGAIQSQESQLYYIKPGSPAKVVEVSSVTDASGFDAPISAVETTTLASDHREYIPGIAEPSSGKVTLNEDPSDTEQVELHALRNAGTILQFAIGDSDGDVAPTLADGSDKFDETPVARSFLYFEGFMTSWERSRSVNGVNQADLGIQLRNRPLWVPAA